jgi:hypothetical protein
MAKKSITMKVKAEQMELIKMIKSINDLAMLMQVAGIVNYILEKKPSFDVAQYNRSIDKSEAEISAGNFVVHDKALKQLKKWKTKRRK